MYYDSDSLADYIENVNIIRTRFPEYIKRIFKDVIVHNDIKFRNCRNVNDILYIKNKL